MEEPEHIATVKSMTLNLRMADKKPKGMNMRDVQRHILQQSGFYSTQPVSNGIECLVCGQRVRITARGYVFTHQDGFKKCKLSNTNYFKNLISQMRRDRWVANAKTAKKPKKKKHGSKGKPKKKGTMNRNDRLIYATGFITTTSGGLPTLGRH